MSFLADLEASGLAHRWFVAMPLGELDKSCCPQAQTTVIDFDHTKTKLGRVPTPKSCDALKILASQQRLDFIEMKSWHEFMRRNPPAAIPAQISKFDLKRKITDSLGVLQDLVMRVESNALPAYLETDKYYIVLIDINLQQNPLQHLAISLEFLSQTATPMPQQIVQALSKELDAMPDLVAKLHPPLLKNCLDIDAYYATLAGGRVS